MTIRFRLTLVYSAILTLTLIVFGFALYSIQSQDTLNSLKQDLKMSSDKIAEALKKDKFSSPDRVPGDQNPPPPPPKPFDEFSNQQAFQDLREREIVRVLDSDGNLVASPFGREEDALPLSNDALTAIHQNQDWYEADLVSEENMLIFSRPIVINGELIYILQVARSLTERDRSLNSLATTLIASGAIMILIAFGVGWVLSGLALKPIDRITQTARAIGDERDFAQRVAYTGKQDEVGQLAMTFNQMLTQLQDAFHKVEHALQQQRNFVTDVSHELRTPLTTLRGNLSLLLRKPPAPSGVQEDILTDMVGESDRLIRLVNDLLLMAHADAGRSLINETVAIQFVLEDAVRQAKQFDDSRQINLDVSGDLNIIGDPDALKQVILILLDNALKYSNDSIDVEGKRVDSHIEIQVQDYGEGIPSEHLEHVFDRFYRADDNSFIPGFGLGLSIAKSLVEAMGGVISIESELGQGTNVKMRFPILDNIND
jgi:two-component system OmpR family sensor kinase